MTKTNAQEIYMLHKSFTRTIKDLNNLKLHDYWSVTLQKFLINLEEHLSDHH